MAAGGRDIRGGSLMAAISPFTEAKNYTAREVQEIRGVQMAAQFNSLAAEYETARSAVALFDRSDRGLLILTGGDRQTWLHNLVTNAVSTLDEGAGNYAFAVNVKGRIIFDLNALCLLETIWIDLDLLAVAVAAAHFDRHLFTEDVKIENASGQYARLGCSGRGVADIARGLGAAHLAALPALGHVTLPDGARLVRHDFAGLPGFELIVPRGQAAAWWDRLVGLGAKPAGHRTLDVLRIEAGIPWLGRDLDDQTIPPETGQMERAVSFHKGCYLGQEVIERMRARGALARRLVQLRTADGSGLSLPTPLMRDGGEVGRITSLVPHPSKPYWPGLGYLKTSVTGYAEISAGLPPRAITITSA
jgi:folate-binding protein YgfZ